MINRTKEKLTEIPVSKLLAHKNTIRNTDAMLIKQR